MTHFVAAMGTTGTMMGTGGYLKERNPAVRLVGVQPDSPFHGLEGLKHLATTSSPPALYDPAVPDVIAEIPTETGRPDRAPLRPGERDPGGLVGRAAVAAGLEIVAREAEAQVVVIGCDTGSRYLSEPHRWSGAVSLRLPDALLEEIRRQGDPAYPAECCGALGAGVRTAGCKEVVRLWPAVNRRTDDPHRYLIAPDDLRRLEREVRAEGLEIVGYYHSHPDHPAVPSAFDTAHAWPWYSYLIVRVDRAAAAELGQLDAG